MTAIIQTITVQYITNIKEKYTNNYLHMHSLIVIKLCFFKHVQIDLFIHKMLHAQSNLHAQQLKKNQN